MAFKAQTQQQYCFQSSFDSSNVNCILYTKLNVKGIYALCKVYLKSTQCQAKMPQNQPNILEICWSKLCIHIPAQKSRASTPARDEEQWSYWPCTYPPTPLLSPS